VTLGLLGLLGAGLGGACAGTEGVEQSTSSGAGAGSGEGGRGTGGEGVGANVGTTSTGGGGGVGGRGGGGSAGGGTGGDATATSSSTGGGGGAGGAGGSGGAGGAGGDATTSSTSSGGQGGFGCDPQPEVCNGLDDNCDTIVDDGDPGGGAACVANGFGVCKDGTKHCVNGAIKCVAGIPTPEICDGLDNNCDGNTDEGNPGGGLQCQTAFMGICSTGITACGGVNGNFCQPSVTPGQLNEACNGLDDDCDGLVDEGIAQVGQNCIAQGFVGICQFGTYSCPAVAPFQLTCDHPLPGTVQEVCNGKDDDCNGTIDDPALVNNVPCATGFPGVCAVGKTQCSFGSSACVPNVNPGAQAEVCDNLDNDCNGAVDDIPNITAACTTQNPNAAHVASWACGAGACTLQACVPGFADINGALADGCECAGDAYSNSCAAPSSVSVPTSANPVTVTGLIESAGGSDYFQFNFTVTAVGADWHPKIQLTNSAGGQYAIDVLSSCGVYAVGDNGEDGQGSDVWEMVYDDVAPGQYVFGSDPLTSCCSDSVAPRPSSMLVRVYRVNADAPTCSLYTIQATNP
jgi:hypothetical protein